MFFYEKFLRNPNHHFRPTINSRQSETSFLFGKLLFYVGNKLATECPQTSYLALPITGLTHCVCVLYATFSCVFRTEQSKGCATAQAHANDDARRTTDRSVVVRYSSCILPHRLRGLPIGLVFFFFFLCLDRVEGHVAETAHHHQRQLGQTDADDEQQRAAQENERRPGEEQPRRCGAECVEHFVVGVEMGGGGVLVP